MPNIHRSSRCSPPFLSWPSARSYPEMGTGTPTTSAPTARGSCGPKFDAGTLHRVTVASRLVPLIECALLALALYRPGLASLRCVGRRGCCVAVVARPSGPRSRPHRRRGPPLRSDDCVGVADAGAMAAPPRSIVTALARRRQRRRGLGAVNGSVIGSAGHGGRGDRRLGEPGRRVGQRGWALG